MRRRRGAARRARVYLSAQGERFSQARRQNWRAAPGWCWWRVGTRVSTNGSSSRGSIEKLSIGDYVLSGGELPALVVIDAVVRLLPGVLGDERSSVEESFAAGLLDWPHYTRPVELEGRQVPRGAAGRQPCGDPALAAEAGGGAHLACGGRI